jgi:phosphoheptose isomerase
MEEMMAAQHVKEIDAAIAELIVSRRQEILQIAQNGANPGPLKNLIDIQMAIDALYKAREQEQ